MSREIADKLKSMRGRLDLTHAELAAKLFVSLTTLKRWESGEGALHGSALLTLHARLDELLKEKLASERRFFTPS